MTGCFPRADFLALALGGAELLFLFVLFGLPPLLLAAGLVIYLVRKRHAPPSAADIAAAKLAELHELKAKGLITEEEFKARRIAVIDEI